MPDYKTMYEKLFRAPIKINKIIEDVQTETEEMYSNAKAPIELAEHIDWGKNQE